MCRKIAFVHSLLRLTQFNAISKPTIQIWGEKMDKNTLKSQNTLVHGVEFYTEIFLLSSF